MYPISTAFRAALLGSHQALTRIEVLDAGAVVRTLDTVIEGKVDVDETAAIRRRATIQLVDPDATLTPATAAALLSPATGNELRIYRGIRTSAGDEYIPLGVFGIADNKIDDTPAGLTISIDGYDRARKVARAKFTDTYTIASGTNVATAIQTLISSRVTGLSYSFLTTTRTTPGVMFEAGDDPWTRAQELALAIGAELFFDPAGVCTLRAVPDPTTAAVDWTYAEGSQATILSTARSFKDEQTFNHVIVTGEGTGITTPVRAEASDTDPTSPTYISGDYGDVPTFLASPLITSTAQAQDVANAILRASLGLIEEVGFSAIVNPAHDAGDIIEIVRERAGISARYVIQALSVPLRASGALTATTRRRKV